MTAPSLLAVAALNAAYAATLDADRLEDWPGFFAEDCVYRITSADNDRAGYAAGIMYADSPAMLRDRVTALRTANIYERQGYRHIVGLPVILAEDERQIQSETPFMIVRIVRGARMDLFATGIYRDHLIIQRDNDLRIAERIVVCDSSDFDTLVAIPL